MKRIIYIICFFIISLCLCGCGKTKDSVTEISFEKLNQKIENKESFILMIGAKSCSHCDMFKITLSEIIKKYKVTIYYIDVDNLSTEEKSELKNQFPYTGTPTTINIVNGIETNSQSRIDGALDYGIVKKRLIKWGYIKEEENE